MRHLALTVMMSAALCALADGRHLSNGGFDKPGATFSTLYNYDGLAQVSHCISLPGWELKGATADNGIIELVPVDDEDNPQYLRIRHYTQGSWAPIKLTAQVSGLTRGKTYALDMYVCHSYSDSNPWARPDHGFKLYGADGQLLISANALSQGEEWENRTFTFKADGNVASLELWSQNLDGEGFRSGLHTVSWDQVSIYEYAPDALSEIEDDVPGHYYTLQGMPVSGALSPGIYIVKRGSHASKILLK